ncbi:MAG TPA: DUF763 domain-containing protein [Deltaproteobacteria bacterium]|nr:DUF763 domain-containing protein [Deltaproteobacteria bacterium]
MRTGTASLPLHGGRAPRWLFERMTRLARQVVIAVVDDGGPRELVRRLSDPFWFQALGCAVGFDWHSSGVTTTLCAALKEALRGMERDVGIFAAGGKGRTSRRTPAEICDKGEAVSAPVERLVYASRMSAKVDSSALQDGYSIYHHSFFFTADGSWVVVQQGMNEGSGLARRYHWVGGTDGPAGERGFVCEPHSGVCCDVRGTALNMVAAASGEARACCAELSRQHPDTLVRELEKAVHLEMPSRHAVTRADINPRRLHKIFLSTYESGPADFEALLAMPGVGAKTVRALSLLAELLYGARASTDDPARFSFAHGGKDGHPYPVDRRLYDSTIEYLTDALERARIGRSDKIDALKRLARMERGTRRR